MLTGIVAGLCVCMFRFFLEAPFPMLGIAKQFDDFESFPQWMRAVFPLVGCFLLWICFRLTPKENHSMGVTHVIDKVQNLKGYLPVKNAILQFVTATIALLSGQSCGREGPSIHLGATSGSLLGQYFRLPNNATRTLIACGSAAAIAAAFNTPIAGVIFVMEVIMMEYSVVSFIPVMISAVSGAVISRLIYENEPVFVIANVSMNSLWELPYVVFMGLVIGTVAAIFIYLHQYCMSFRSVDIGKRLVVIGVFTALVGSLFPEVMGAGYDTINAALQNHLDLPFLLIFLVCKLSLTAVVLGLGLPGGVIGQSLIIGGIAGAVLGIAGNSAAADYAATPAFYVLLGMCAMMGAVLQAPLAALMALLELSGNMNLMLPAMLVIVVANLTTTELFKLPSVLQLSLQRQGIVTPKAFSRLLHRFGVNVILNTDYIVQDISKADDEIAGEAEVSQGWVLLKDGGEYRLCTGKKLTDLYALQTSKTALQMAFSEGDMVVAIPLQSTLQQALELLDENNLQYAYVYSKFGLGSHSIMGVLSRSDIENFYKLR